MPSASPRATGEADPPDQTFQVGSVRLDGKTSESVRSLVSSAIVLVPDNCGCDQSLARLTDQAYAAGARGVLRRRGRAQRAADARRPPSTAASRGRGGRRRRRARRRLPPGRPHRAARLQRRHRRGPQEPLRQLPRSNLTPGELNSPGAKAGGQAQAPGPTPPRAPPPAEYSLTPPTRPARREPIRFLRPVVDCQATTDVARVHDTSRRH